jgi:hypothetical protein
MTVFNCSLRYRPVRIGWCIRLNDWSAYRETLDRNFILAGGLFNPIILIDDEIYARALVKAFRVDLLLSVTEDNKIQAFIDKFPHLTPPHLSRAFWDTFQGGQVPFFVDISHPIKKYFGEPHKNSPDYQLINYDWQSDDPLANIFLATYGKIRAPFPQERDYLALLDKGVSIESKILAPDDPFPILIHDPLTLVPSALSRLGLQQHYEYSNRWAYDGFYIGHADNFQDIINFWNLKATDTRVIFYDPAYADRLQERKQDALSSFVSRNKGAMPHTPPFALWGRSLDILQKETSGWASSAQLCKMDIISWNGANIIVPYMYFTQHQVMGIQSTIPSGKSRITIQPPAHPFDDDVFSQGQQMVVAIQPCLSQLIDHTTTLQLPFIPELNSYYDRACHSGVGLCCTRIEPDGIGFIECVRYHDLSFQPINTAELIHNLFAHYGMETAFSDAGLLTQRLIHQMGGLQGCRIFKFQGVRDLINKFTPFDSFTRGGATQVIFGSADSFKKHEDLYLEGEKVKDGGKIFKKLLQKNVFSVGLDLECPHCLLGFWTPCDRLDNSMACEHCGHVFNMLLQLQNSCDWKFRPSSLFITRDKQKGAVPVILTLQLLELELGWGEMPYCSSTIFRKKGRSPFEGESDFVIVLPKPNTEGKIEVILSECKSKGAENAEDKLEGGKITDRDIEKLKTIAAALPTDQFCVYTIFSKLAPFSKEELDRISSLTPLGIRPIVFATQDLEALHPYAILRQKHNQARYTGRLKNMADITDYLILSDRQDGYSQSSVAANAYSISIGPQ